ncbi:MAG: hypothetical protein V4524_04115 [Patescibacteria group bacterium]
MTLNEFINKLEMIAKEHGGSDEVVMADFIPIVDPVYVDGFIFGRKIVITDQD